MTAMGKDQPSTLESKSASAHTILSNFSLPIEDTESPMISNDDEEETDMQQRSPTESSGLATDKTLPQNVFNYVFPIDTRSMLSSSSTSKFSTSQAVNDGNCVTLPTPASKEKVWE